MFRVGHWKEAVEWILRWWEGHKLSKYEFLEEEIAILT